MITVSDGFKESIKSPNREIFAYVDVDYQNVDYEQSVSKVPEPLKNYVNDGRGLVDGSKIMIHYVTLENNYTLLDGSFTLWNGSFIDYRGYTSDAVFNNINNTTIIVKNDSTDTPVKGVTIYFVDNLPFDFDVTFTDTGGNTIVDKVTNNTRYVYQYIFENEINLNEMSLMVSSVEFPDNRLRIAYIDFNISDCYQGDELISFDVTEELDVLVESLPINTCTINLTNYSNENGDNKFDVINPKGIVKYMTDDTIVKPYIGVYGDKGVEYVSLGKFYLDDWSSDVDGSVTINAKSVLNKIKGSTMIWKDSKMFGSMVTTNELSTMIKDTTGITCYFPTDSMYIDNWSNTHTNLYDYLTYISPCLLFYNADPEDSTSIDYYRIMFTNRYNAFEIHTINDDAIVDKISREELLEDVKYTNKTPIKDVVVNYSLTSSESSTTTKTIVNVMYTLTKTEEYLWFEVEDYIAYLSSYSGTVQFGSATFTHLGFDMHLIHAKVTGDVGSIISIKYVAAVASSSKNSYSITYTNNSVNTGDTLTLDFGDCEIPNFDSIMTVFFDMDTKYSISAETMGDPSLEIGDRVSIQTRYPDENDGYKNIMITKQTFTYDGGLSCSLEGIGD